MLGMQTNQIVRELFGNWLDTEPSLRLRDILFGSSWSCSRAWARLVYVARELELFSFTVYEYVSLYGSQAQAQAQAQVWFVYLVRVWYIFLNMFVYMALELDSFVDLTNNWCIWKNLNTRLCWNKDEFKLFTTISF